jgi:hypothetical protein
VVLRVVVFGKGRATPAFTSAFESYSPTTPPVERTRFAVPRGADFDFDAGLDIADAANQYAPVLPPDTVAGLAKSPQADRAVGIYGSGVTRLLTIPLRDREADPLREQLRLTPGVQTIPEGTLVTIGPLGVLMTGDDSHGGWLIAGTVTADTLTRAAEDLFRGTVIVGDGR